MTRRALRAGWLLCLGLLGAPASAANADTGTPETGAGGDVRIERVRNRDGVHGLKGTIVVRAPRQAVWALLTEHERFPETFPNVKSARTVSSDEKGAEVEFFIESPWTKYSYVARRDYLEPGKRLAWRKIKGDYGTMVGEWTIEEGPDKDHLRVTSTSFVDLWAAAPTAVIREFAIGEMRRSLRRVRARLESAPQ